MADLSPGEWAVLGALAEGPTHGFAVAQLLGPTGPLGRVWTLPRPVVYQAIKKLTEQGLVAATATQRSDRGPARTIIEATQQGEQQLRRWLDEPVAHVRDVRSLLLLKLALLDRAGRDPVPLLRAQRASLLPRLARHRATLDGAEGFDRVVAQWRLASLQATLQFLEAAAAPALLHDGVS